MQNNSVFDEIVSLGDNWNGYDAEPFEPIFVGHCRNIAAQLVIEPEVFPTACNSIQFEYENDEVYLEFEIFEDCVDIFVMKNGIIEKDYKIFDNYVDEMNKLIIHYGF